MRYFSSRSQIALKTREPRLHDKNTHLLDPARPQLDLTTGGATAAAHQQQISGGALTTRVRTADRLSSVSTTGIHVCAGLSGLDDLDPPRTHLRQT